MRISWRRKAGPTTGALLGLAFAGVLVAIGTAERWLGVAERFRIGAPAPVTVRIPDLAVYRDERGAPLLRAGRVVVARGEEVTPEKARIVSARLLRSGGTATIVGLFVGFALIGILLSTYLRGAQRGRLLRVQITVLGSIALLAASVQAYLLYTPLSSLLVPVAALALLAGGLIERNVGLALAVATAVVIGALTPFDAPVAIVLGTQGVAGVLSFTRAKRRRAFLWAGLVAGVTAAGAYVATYFLHAGALPFDELRSPAHSALLASLGGGIASGPLAIALRGAFERLMGEIPKARLVEFADLEHPLLKKIAAEAPGTWQHSLAMANMAEIVANAIGANALLVRVGAYYHDLGKSQQPQFYIENLAPGQPSPHDQIDPEVSAERIFAHVTEGVRLARAHGLPEAIVDFMHMHHGDGVLEYFWAKCLEQGNPKKLTVDAFRYPGVKPQSRETAILTICDAVEAASRTLKTPDARAIETLVQRIVYGKLHLGQLDESGLTVADLKTIANKLVEILEHAHHVRIEYPWQREEALRRSAEQPTVAGTPGAIAAAAETQPGPRPRRPSGEATQRFFVERALDSADIPRPYWQEARPLAPARPREGGVPENAWEASATADTLPVMPPAALGRATGAEPRTVPGARTGRAPASSFAPAAAIRPTELAAVAEAVRVSAPEIVDEGRGPVVEIGPKERASPAAGRAWTAEEGAPASKTDAIPPLAPGEIELMKDPADAPGRAQDGRAAGALFNGVAALAPGHVILGAPPATHPPEAQSPHPSEPPWRPRPTTQDGGAESPVLVTPAVPSASTPPPRRRPSVPPARRAGETSDGAGGGAVGDDDSNGGERNRS